MQALFVPSQLTCQSIGIPPVSRNFDEAYDSWVASLCSYRDQYGFRVPLGVYNPSLVRKQDIEDAEGVNEERYDEEAGMFMSPIK